jgi:stage III sporulation protein AD
MNIMQIAATAVVSVVLAVVLKKEKPVFAVIIGAVAGIMIIISVVPQLKSIIDLASDIGEMAGENGYVGILFKIIGVAYVAQFASDICRDAGETALAARVMLAGKIIVAFYSMPVAAGLMEQINTMFG